MIVNLTHGRIIAIHLFSQTTLFMEIKTPFQQECLQTQYSRHRRRRFLRTSSLAALAAPALLSGLGSGKATAAIKGGMVPLVGSAEPSPMQGAVAALERSMTRSLHLVNEHTGDDVKVVYYTHGIYMHDNLARLNNLMRDRRANLATQMDTTLYDQLFLLQRELGTDEPVHVLSGFRTEATNAKLRKRSKSVAKFSLHMAGRAADIYIPGYSAQKIQSTAVAMMAGGVGLYSRSNFVHVDTGDVRYWGS